MKEETSRVSPATYNALEEAYSNSNSDAGTVQTTARFDKHIFDRIEELSQGALSKAEVIRRATRIGLAIIPEPYTRASRIIGFPQCRYNRIEELVQDAVGRELKALEDELIQEEEVRADG